MTKKEEPSDLGTIAPLQNVALMSQLVGRVLNRSPGLPGMACFYGPSGFGKTKAAIFASNRHRAFHVQVQSTWTRKKLSQAIAEEMSLGPQPTIADTVEAIGQELALSGRPLIIDEADYLLRGSFIELVRDIYEASQGTVILIGEENLPHKLRKWERVHGRMLDWTQAQPASDADVKHIARLYCKGVEVADDLFAAVVKASAKSVRRLCVNFDRVREAAATASLKRIDRDHFHGELFTGEPPARRAA